jgi:hypothetical protein
METTNWTNNADFIEDLKKARLEILKSTSIVKQPHCFGEFNKNKTECKFKICGFGYSCKNNERKT